MKILLINNLLIASLTSFFLIAPALASSDSSATAEHSQELRGLKIAQEVEHRDTGWHDAKPH